MIRSKSSKLKQYELEDKSCSVTSTVCDDEELHEYGNQSTLTRRRHDMGNSLGDETSCKSSTPLTYSTLNVLAPNGQ